MHNHDDKYMYPTRPGFEPGTCRLQAPLDTNESSGLALKKIAQFVLIRHILKRMGLIKKNKNIVVNEWLSMS